MNGIMPTSGAAVTGEPTKLKNNSSAMGKDEFLKLLITQLKHQDPLKPMDNKEFIAQTAQFSSLEQMNSMNSNLTKSLDMQQLTQMSGLVNKEVTVLDSNTGDEVTGIVEKVKMKDDGPRLVINGQDYNLGSVNEVLG
ncbi:flagellar hook capping FlgD N-terminal domain-containing protein [Selenihalanaerobacter shriftii]|uniref:Flagellar basal-body rod modification protein FlgD n=1 Tax=Selenihalanaerobacter shriftii TaxID=142842 RepID=A0A1T4MB10_9FIRM|nr:flagellar hook capping FlgD N-terminal domain-containing protein [Selenihalanaerobacter shriftii]SJZ64230.1 flagellar basal-body rod modification protein FlgD [Selenihalanaerobacter shriftii]